MQHINVKQSCSRQKELSSISKLSKNTNLVLLILSICVAHSEQGHIFLPAKVGKGTLKSIAPFGWYHKLKMNKK